MEKQKSTNQREAGMMLIAGVQGVGKTYQSMHLIKEYVKDKFYNKVKGRRCLIFDTNGEFVEEQFASNDIPNFKVKTIALQDIEEWSQKGAIECRRIDAKNLSISEKKAAVEFIIKFYKNGMLVLEDINTYILSMTHMENIVSGLVNLRHRAVDVAVSYQALRPIEPRMFQNARWIRLHHQTDLVEDVKNKIPNHALYKIAQIIVSKRYFNSDKRFFVYIYNFQNKIVGKFTKQEFMDACRQYLNANKKYIKEYQNMNSCSVEEAIEGQIKQYINEYYGNK
jgi:hypothetical protein